MYTLYYMPGACSMAVHVVLNELGQQVKLEKVGEPGNPAPKPESFLKLSPRGQVPVLVDGDFSIREGAAIITYLCDKHESVLLPRSGKERAAALEWLMFCNATLHPAYGRAFGALRVPEDVRDKALTAAVEQINVLWKEVENRLTQTPYLAGDKLTAGDILLTVIANWANYIPKPIQMGSATKKLLKTVSARPSYQKALATEKVEYKVAA